MVCCRLCLVFFFPFSQADLIDELMTTLWRTRAVFSVSLVCTKNIFLERLKLERIGNICVLLATFLNQKRSGFDNRLFFLMSLTILTNPSFATWTGLTMLMASLLRTKWGGLVCYWYVQFVSLSLWRFWRFVFLTPCFFEELRWDMVCCWYV